VRFGPESFGCHEGVHVTKLVVDLIQEQLIEHSAVPLNPYCFYCVREAQQLLYAAYNSIGGEHLDVPMPTDDRPRLTLCRRIRIQSLRPTTSATPLISC
jgi:hypothetical protein